MNWNLFYELFLSTYESLGVLLVTAVCCAVIGTFFVLRGLSMLSDAISHSVLLGIVLTFFLVKEVSSPWLLAGAALFGVLTVFSVETLSSTGLVQKQDAVGIVFPLFFALAVILISKYARNVHLDTDMVLMGEVIMAPLYRVSALGLSLPRAFVQMGLILLLNLLFILVFYKELKVSSFDPDFTVTLGFSSTVLFYALMSLSSLTAVAAFDAAGAILTVSFLIAPGACAAMISKDLRQMLRISVLYAILNSLIGYVLALALQISMSGMVASVAGVSFLLTFLFRREGLITGLVRQEQRRREFLLDLMLMHIGNHMHAEDAREELGVDSIQKHLNWPADLAQKRGRELLKQGMIEVNRVRRHFILTKKGVERYEKLRSEYGM